MARANLAGLAPSPPRTIGRYRIRGELGRGMMGVVYDAYDPTLGRQVALKTVQVSFCVTERDGEAFERRFFAEARAAARLQHPNVVVIHDLGRDPQSGVLFMALERLSGRTLAELLASGERPDWRETLRIGARIADALRAAHAEGIVHRDIKPANVVLLPGGEPKILDFGIAKLPASELTAAGQVFGTPANMSPEQARGEAVDARSDLFSLGTVLYEMLTGQRAFHSESIQTILMLLSERDPPPPSSLDPGLPPAVDALVARLLAKDPAGRPRSAGQLVGEIEALLAGEAIPPATPGTAPPGAGGTAPAPPPTLDLESELEALVAEVPTRTQTGRRLRAGRTPYWLGIPAAILLGLAVAGVDRGPALEPTSGGRAAARGAGTAPRPADPALVEVDFEHHLSSGHLRIWVDGDVALDRWLEPESEKSIVGVKLRRGELRETLEISPGTHDVRVRLAWDDNLRSETSTAHFAEGESRLLRVRLSRLTKALSLDWN